LYLNGDTIGSIKYEKYPNDSSFKENTLGCSSVGVKFYNSFFGEMTAVHFVAVNEFNMDQVHKFISKIAPLVEIEDFSLLANRGKINNPRLKQALESGNMDLAKLQESVFLSANPKLVTEDSENIKHSTFQHGYIKSIYSMTKVYHNLSLKDSFMSIGGIGSLLFLKNIPSALKLIINIIIEIALSDSQHMKLFLMQEGIKTLSYVIEIIATTINDDILSSLITLKNTLSNNYPSSYIDYMQLIYFNPKVWSCSSEKVKREVLGSIVSNDKELINCYMDFILELSDSSNSDEFFKLCAETFQHITTNEQTLNNIMENLMSYTGRLLQYTNCPVQTYLILSSCLQLFNSRIC
jgi:hypothetical protein